MIYIDMYGYHRKMNSKQSNESPHRLTGHMHVLPKGLASNYIANHPHPTILIISHH